MRSRRGCRIARIAPTVKGAFSSSIFVELLYRLVAQTDTNKPFLPTAATALEFALFITHSPGWKM
jgi:hypothetical protein